MNLAPETRREIIRTMIDFKHGFGVGFAAGVSFVAVFLLLWL